MPLQKARGKSKSAINAAVSDNIRELVEANKTKAAGKQRGMRQIVAISESVARGRKGKRR